MIKLFAIAILLTMTTSAQAYTAHCQHHGGPWKVCHLCHRGHWPTGEDYECSAKAERRQERDRALMNCMVDLTQMPDAKLKRWCLKQSRIMP
jgi:hypothetical protein